MRIFIMLLCLFLGRYSLYGQSFAVANENLNFVYWGVPNILHIAVENLACEEIRVSTDNGIIVQHGGGCTWEFTPERSGGANLTLFRRLIPNDTIGTMYLRTKDIPQGEAMFGGKHGGYILRGVLRELRHVYADIADFEYRGSLKLVITEYIVTIQRNKQIIFCDSSVGYGRLSPKTIEAFSKTIKGDSVSFSHIKARPAIESGNALREPLFTQYPVLGLDSISFIVVDSFPKNTD